MNSTDNLQAREDEILRQLDMLERKVDAMAALAEIKRIVDSYRMFFGK